MSEDDAPLLGPRIYTLREILTDPLASETPQAVAPALAWKGRVSLLPAREKAGKSTLSSAAAAAVSRGGEFLGEACPRGRVLWLSLEEHRADLASRFVQFGADEDNIFVVDNLTDPIADTMNVVAEVQPSLLVIDTLAAFAEGQISEAGSAAEWTPFMRGITKIAREYEVAVLVLHHARKSDGKYRDSTAIGANVDVIMTMNGEGEAPRKLSYLGRWKIDDVAAKMSDGKFVLVSGQLGLKNEIVRAIKASPGLSKRALRAAVTRKAADVDAAVTEMLKAGEIVNVGSDAAWELHLSKKIKGSVSQTQTLGA